MISVTVVNRLENERYVAEVDGEIAGYCVYHIRHGGIYFFVHTEILESFAHRGVGQVLVREALDDVRKLGAKVVPLCPYVAAFIDNNPEYDDLVNHEIFDRIADRLHAE